jgi:hypothetical protein
MTDIEFNIDANPEYTWAAWGNTNYPTLADVIGEIIDNSLQANATECRVLITMENGIRILRIEDNGSWGKLDQTTLTKCFGFGKKAGSVKIGLNEHNCGLKQVLANTDPANANWAVQIKQKGIVREIRAPYNHRMKFCKTEAYLGSMNCDNSTVVQTVISDTQFKTLYLNDRKGKPNDKLLIARLKMYLATMWMMNSKVINGEFSIYLNGEVIKPYTLYDKNGVRKMENANTKPFPLQLSSEAKPIMVEVWKYHLSLDFAKDHPIFRRHPDNSGVYIFKHGRLVKGRIFTEIFDVLRDYKYGGYLLLVNLTGDTQDLPATQTTKSDFSNRDEKLERLYEEIKNNYYPHSEKPSEVRVQCEKELMQLIYKQKKANHKKEWDREYYAYPEKILELTVEGQRVPSKEEIDILEWNTKSKTVNIIEGKIAVITPQNLRQLFFYYRNLKYFCVQFSDYTIETQFITTDDTITPEYKNELLMLQALDSEFNPEIETFETYGI